MRRIFLRSGLTRILDQNLRTEADSKISGSAHFWSVSLQISITSGCYQRHGLVTVATVSTDTGILGADLRPARWQQVVAQVLSEARLAGRKSALRRGAVVQLLPVVGDVGIGDVTHDVIVEEHEEETMTLSVDLADEQRPEVNRAPDGAQKISRENNDCHLRTRTTNVFAKIND